MMQLVDTYFEHALNTTLSVEFIAETFVCTLLTNRSAEIALIGAPVNSVDWGANQRYHFSVPTVKLCKVLFVIHEYSVPSCIFISKSELYLFNCCVQLPAWDLHVDTTANDLVFPRRLELTASLYIT